MLQLQRPQQHLPHQTPLRQRVVVNESFQTEGIQIYQTETILEIDGDIALATDEVAQRLNLESAQFLEKRNGLAQIVRVPKLNKDFSASAIGTIEFQRPGYIRIVQSDARINQWLIAAAIGVGLFVAVALWIARSRRGSRDVSGNISR